MILAALWKAKERGSSVRKGCLLQRQEGLTCSPAGDGWVPEQHHFLHMGNFWWQPPKGKVSVPFPDTLARLS